MAPARATTGVPCIRGIPARLIERLAHTRRMRRLRPAVRMPPHPCSAAHSRPSDRPDNGLGAAALLMLRRPTLLSPEWCVETMERRDDEAQSAGAYRGLKPAIAGTSTPAVTAPPLRDGEEKRREPQREPVEAAAGFVRPTAPGRMRSRRETPATATARRRCCRKTRSPARRCPAVPPPGPSRGGFRTRTAPRGPA